MALKLRRPILVGGLGLTMGAWLLQWGHPSGSHWGDTLMWGAIALGGGAWWLRQQTKPTIELELPKAPVDRAAVDAALTDVETRIAYLEAEQSGQVNPALREQLASLKADLERPNLRVAIAGGTSVGKSTLVQRLLSDWAPGLTQSLSISEISGLLDASDSSTVSTADLVIFVASSDLTDSELQGVQQLLRRQQRVVLAFNKQDQYLPEERPLVLQQIRERLLGLLPVQDVVAIATAPAPLKVRQYQPDGTTLEKLEQPAPTLTALTERLTAVVTTAAPQLILNTTLRQVEDLKTSVQTELNRIRRDRALPLIEQSQWIAGAAAFATPVPTLDLVATTAVNAQLVMDLGAIYQQQFSLDQAKTVIGTLAEQMVKQGIVEASTQAIAPLLKSHALTFVAGGLLQGISAAYLTRLAGLSLVEYFQEQSQLPVQSQGVQSDRLLQKLKAVFQQNQRTAFLQMLVQQGISRLAPKSSESSLPNASVSA